MNGLCPGIGKCALANTSFSPQLSKDLPQRLDPNSNKPPINLNPHDDLGGLGGPYNSDYTLQTYIEVSASISADDAELMSKVGNGIDATKAFLKSSVISFGGTVAALALPVTPEILGAIGGLTEIFASFCTFNTTTVQPGTYHIVVAAYSDGINDIAISRISHEGGGVGGINTDWGIIGYDPSVALDSYAGLPSLGDYSWSRVFR